MTDDGGTEVDADVFPELVTKDVCLVIHDSEGGMLHIVKYVRTHAKTPTCMELQCRDVASEELWYSWLNCT